MCRFGLSPSHRVDQVVACGLWNVDPVHFNGCAKVLDILVGTRICCHLCPSRASQTWPVSMLAVHKRGCFQLPGILHGSLQVYDRAATWGEGRGYNNGSQDLVTVSLGIFAALRHRLWAFAGYNDGLQAGRDSSEDDKHADELPWEDFWHSVQEQTFWLCKPIVEVAVRVAALRPSLSEHAGFGGPGLMWLHIPVVLDVLPNSLKRLWRIEHSIHEQQLWWTFLQSACQFYTPS